MPCIEKLFDRKRNFELENLAGYLSHIDTMLTNRFVSNTKLRWLDAKLVRGADQVTATYCIVQTGFNQ